MKNLKKSINSYSFTEKLTFSILFFFLFTLAFSFVMGKGNVSKTVLGQETSESSTESDDVDSTDETSVKTEESTDETDSVDEVSVKTEESTDEVDDVDEISVASLEDEEELSTVSDDSEISVSDETSVSDFETVVKVDENTSIVSSRGRLFFLIPVEIKKTLSLNDQGEIVSVQQSLLSRILELLSF